MVRNPVDHRPRQYSLLRLLGPLLFLEVTVVLFLVVIELLLEELFLVVIEVLLEELFLGEVGVLLLGALLEEVEELSPLFFLGAIEVLFVLSALFEQEAL